jgi:energy-coupling factor transporter ATP-binding protein EcfA2
VRVPKKRADEVSRLVNEENCRRHGVPVGDPLRSFCLVKEDKKPPPTNPYQPERHECPLQALPEAWREVVETDTSDFDPLVLKIYENGGAFLDGWAGVGKSTLVDAFVKLVEAKGEKVRRCAYQVATAKRDGGHSLLASLRGGIHEHWLVVDEVSQLSSLMWSQLSLLRYSGTKLLICGDFTQLQSVTERFADALPPMRFESTKVLRGVANDLKIRLQRQHRFERRHGELVARLSEDVRAGRRYVPDFARFPCRDLAALPDFIVCQCHDTRISANAVANQAVAQDPDAYFFKAPEKDHSNCKQQDMYVVPGMRLLGVRGSRKIVNGLIYTVEYIHTEAKGRVIQLRPEKGELIDVPEDVFVKCLRLSYAVTCNYIQGLSIYDKTVWFLDARAFHTTLRHYYVAVSRVHSGDQLSVLTREQQDQLLHSGPPA